MRHLNRRQKFLLDNWFSSVMDKEQITGTTILGIGFDIEYCDDFPIELLMKLRSINDFEILFQCVNHYISDKVSDHAHRLD